MSATATLVDRHPINWRLDWSRMEETAQLLTHGEDGTMDPRSAWDQTKAFFVDCATLHDKVAPALRTLPRALKDHLKTSLPATANLSLAADVGNLLKHGSLEQTPWSGFDPKNFMIEVGDRSTEVLVNGRWRLSVDVGLRRRDGAAIPAHDSSASAELARKLPRQLRDIAVAALSEWRPHLPP